MLPLSPRQLDLWLLVTDTPGKPDPAIQCAALYATLLDDGERARARRFLRAADRCRFVLTRALVRDVLSRYADVAPAAWRFGTTAFGRPTILAAAAPAGRIVFNVAHAEGLIMLGVTTGRPLGIDTERMDADPPAGVAGVVFGDAERAALEALPARERRQRFFDLWTLKESYLKARGTGFAIPPDAIAFALEEPGRIDYTLDPREPASRWLFVQWSPTPAHRAALCTAVLPAGPPEVTVRHVLPGAPALPVAFLPDRTCAG